MVRLVVDAVNTVPDAGTAVHHAFVQLCHTTDAGIDGGGAVLLAVRGVDVRVDDAAGVIALLRGARPELVERAAREKRDRERDVSDCSALRV